MSQFYSDLAESAAGLIAEFGMDARLVRMVPGTYNPATGTNTNTSISYNGKGIKFDHPTKDRTNLNIEQQAKKVYLSVKDVAVPQVNDLVCFGAACYTILGVKDVSPAGQSVVYILDVK